MKRQDRFFNTLQELLNVKNDARLCDKLNIPSPILSKYRSGDRKIGATAVLQIHEKTNIEVKVLRSLIEI